MSSHQNASIRLGAKRWIAFAFLLIHGTTSCSASAQTPDITGVWISSKFGACTIVQSSSEVLAALDYPNGDRGQLSGSISGTSLKFQWQSKSDRGHGEFTLSNDRKSLMGFWKNAITGKQDSWILKRADLSGTWNSAKAGTCRLLQTADRVQGKLTFRNGNTGDLAGRVEGRTLRYEWATATDRGIGEFTLAVDGKSLRGTWRSPQTGRTEAWELEKGAAITVQDAVVIRSGNIFAVNRSGRTVGIRLRSLVDPGGINVGLPDWTFTLDPGDEKHLLTPDKKRIAAGSVRYFLGTSEGQTAWKSWKISQGKLLIEINDRKLRNGRTEFRLPGGGVIRQTKPDLSGRMIWESPRINGRQVFVERRFEKEYVELQDQATRQFVRLYDFSVYHREPIGEWYHHSGGSWKFKAMLNLISKPSESKRGDGFDDLFPTFNGRDLVPQWGSGDVPDTEDEPVMVAAAGLGNPDKLHFSDREEPSDEQVDAASSPPAKQVTVDANRTADAARSAEDRIKAAIAQKKQQEFEEREARKKRKKNEPEQAKKITNAVAALDTERVNGLSPYNPFYDPITRQRTDKKQTKCSEFLRNAVKRINGGVPMPELKGVANQQIDALHRASNTRGSGVMTVDALLNSSSRQYQQFRQRNLTGPRERNPKKKQFPDDSLRMRMAAAQRFADRSRIVIVTWRNWQKDPTRPDGFKSGHVGLIVPSPDGKLHPTGSVSWGGKTAHMAHAGDIVRKGNQQYCKGGEDGVFDRCSMWLGFEAWKMHDVRFFVVDKEHMDDLRY